MSSSWASLQSLITSMVVCCMFIVAKTMGYLDDCIPWHSFPSSCLKFFLPSFCEQASWLSERNTSRRSVVSVNEIEQKHGESHWWNSDKWQLFSLPVTGSVLWNWDLSSHCSVFSPLNEDRLDMYHIWLLESTGKATPGTVLCPLEKLNETLLRAL